MIDLKSQRLLIIAPHPDDEVIGCGGLIQKIKEKGGKVFVLFLTVGDTWDFSKEGSSTASQRRKEIEKVAKFLGYDDYHIAFEGNDYHLKLDLLGQKKIMDMIERESAVSVEKARPTIMAFPSFSSYNQDHRAAAVAAQAAARPAAPSEKHFIPVILSYEEAVGSWSIQKQEERSLLYISFTRKELDSKLKAMGLYNSQIRPFPNLRSFKALKLLASLRGAEAGQEYAEVFKVYRLVI